MAASAGTDPIYQQVLAGAQLFIQGTQERQALIADIEKASGRRLIVYHATTQHQMGAMAGSDVNAVFDMCDDLGPRKVPVDFMIHSPGGDANAAEIILNTIYQRAATLRVLVPRSAKSAGTLLAMGAGEIVMGVASELGPVDPQFTVVVGGIPRYLPGQAIVDAYDGLQTLIHDGMAAGLQVAGYAHSLQQIDPAFVNEARRQIEHSKAMGKRWLVKSMYPGDDAKAAAIMDALSDANVHKSHGRMIDAKMAKDDIGLRVRILTPRNNLWRMLWKLHLLNEFWMSQVTAGPGGQGIARVKLFETKKVSIAQHGPLG